MLSRITLLPPTIWNLTHKFYNNIVSPACNNRLCSDLTYNHLGNGAPFIHNDWMYLIVLETRIVDSTT
jgi:hypothetical protein